MWVVAVRNALTRRVLIGVQVRRCGVALRNETRVKDRALAFMTFTHTHTHTGTQTLKSSLLTQTLSLHISLAVSSSDQNLIDCSSIILIDGFPAESGPLSTYHYQTVPL